MKVKPTDARSQGERPPHSRYSAPALEKGLDVLEALAEEAEGLSQNQIAQRLGRSVGEIYRMLDGLERRGYIRRRESDGLYHLTLRLFELAHRHPPTERLLAEAMPAMRRLAREAGQSCHLSLYDDGWLLVVADVPSPEPMGFSVRLGGRFAFRDDRVSARVISAFQDSQRREELVAEMLAGRVREPAQGTLLRRLSAIRARGYDEAPSDTIGGIVDISVPVFDHTGNAVAGLTLPYLQQRDVRADIPAARRLLMEAARAISDGLGAPTATDGRTLTRPLPPGRSPGVDRTLSRKRERV